MDVGQEVTLRLQAVEQEHGCKILYACESGSRSWGFASSDSDYDVRFLYCWWKDWYLDIDSEKKRDVIEQPPGPVWDINGWDIRKALQLFRKCNPSLLEWLQSPIVYREPSFAVQRLQELIPTYYSRKPAFYHYYHMARGNAFKYVLGKEMVKRKKYLYVLRPLLACRWIETHNAPVPVEFMTLVAIVGGGDALRLEIIRLVKDKMENGELGEVEPNPIFTNFIKRELERHEADDDPFWLPRNNSQKLPGAEPLTQVFHMAMDDVG